MFLDQAEGVTGKSIRTLKRYIKQGKLRGRQAGKNVNSPLQVWIDAKSLVVNDDEHIDDPDILDAESSEVDFSPEPGESDSNDVGQQRIDPYQHAIQTMTAEFTKFMKEQQEESMRLRAELQEKEIQLRLLPDLERKLNDKDKKLSDTENDAHLEKTALQKQISAMQDSIELKERMLAEVKAENEALKVETEALKNKPSWWSWFLGKPAK